MESRLPKPSALKKPMSLTRTVLPMDRIKSSASNSTGLGSKSTHLLNGSTASLYPFQPLTRDLTNLQNPRGNSFLLYNKI